MYAPRFLLCILVIAAIVDGGVANARVHHRHRKPKPEEVAAICAQISHNPDCQLDEPTKAVDQSNQDSAQSHQDIATGAAPTAPSPKTDAGPTEKTDQDTATDDGDDDDNEPHRGFYGDIVMSWEHSFGEAGWSPKLFYDGGFRMITSDGRKYDIFRFDNEMAIPPNTQADEGTRTIHDADHIYNVKAVQLQQHGKDGKYANDDDDLLKNSKFYGQVVDENDYDRRLHYFIAIPVGWDRSFEKQLTHSLTLIQENEVGVAGVAVAGIYSDDGHATNYGGAHLFRAVNSVAFEFAKGSHTLTVTPMEFTTDCSVFRVGVNCEWEATATVEYHYEKLGAGFVFETSHKSGLPAFNGLTQSENVERIGVSLDAGKTARAVGHGAAKAWNGLFHSDRLAQQLSGVK